MIADRILPSGTRVVVDRLAATGVVAVSVAYRGGMRSDPPGAPGLAHLVEHVSFGALAEHAGLVDATGGSASAFTHSDHTEFSTVVPAAALADVLDLEARRTRPARVDAAGLERQVRVLDEEIRTQIDSQDFAGHTVRDLPQLLLDDARLVGDGYGSADALAHVTPDDVAAFMARGYRPSDAVVVLAGDVDPEEGAALVESTWGDLGPAPSDPPAAPTSAARTVAPPFAGLPTATRTGGASAPAAVRGVVLSPAQGTARSLGEHLAEVLALQAVAETRGLLCRAGIFEPLAALDPDLAFLARYLGPGETPGDVADEVDDALAEVADGRAPDGLVLSLALRWHRRLSAAAAEPLTRSRSLARATVLVGDPHLPDTVLRTLAGTGRDDVAAAAARLRGARGALLHVTPALVGGRA
ncbi:predicted Zn-dependent peptidase [Sanguibacter keddieii DSM 10542]|uniref:Predicted Zn-dependent peptidase n=1 Tax=Sanguibacter keddieii (strain ATCC 51767 / DSM 10542 / NCFB 3025 / ST-74) TaxID=446469 RepID=D1BDY3_SANKS|nr:insulinase family protein [Sanguibacter keddieii]ACZ23204.1 predicted Zn-dependent peptidase [Sanguibacter keddieii DSM 10542]